MAPWSRTPGFSWNSHLISTRPAVAVPNSARAEETRGLGMRPGLCWTKVLRIRPLPALQIAQARADRQRDAVNSDFMPAAGARAREGNGRITRLRTSAARHGIFRRRSDRIPAETRLAARISIAGSGTMMTGERPGQSRRN